MNKIAKLSLVAITAFTLGLGFAAGANALPGVKPKGATLQDLGSGSAGASPEIAAAEQRVDQAKAQVDLANKQVAASRALLKAAQADLKAASAQVIALREAAAAQGLVDQTGMTPAKAAPVSIADKGPVNKDQDAAPAPAPAPAPTPVPNPDEARIKTEGSDTPEPILLR